jgi:hypothetical protein
MTKRPERVAPRLLGVFMAWIYNVVAGWTADLEFEVG